MEQFDEEFFKTKARYLYDGYICETVKRTVAVVKDNKVVHDWSLLYDKDHYIKLYTERNKRIIQYFEKRPDDLLVIDITKEKDISKILEFLGLPAEANHEMPHRNSSK